MERKVKFCLSCNHYNWFPKACCALGCEIIIETTKNTITLGGKNQTKKGFKVFPKNFEYCVKQRTTAATRH